MNTDATPAQQRTCYESLASAECPGCHHAKLPRQSFCRTCYFTLPQWLQRTLYREDDYCRAWGAALEYLNPEAVAAARHAAPLKEGDRGLGWEQSDTEGRRFERVQVEILEVRGPVLRVKWKTSWLPWRKGPMARKDFTPEGEAVRFAATGRGPTLQDGSLPFPA